MKNRINQALFSIALLTIIAIVHSCAPISKCQDASEDSKVKGSKRLKAVVSERDSLCNTLQTAEKDISKLQKERDLDKRALKELNGERDNLARDINELQSNYEALMNKNLSQEEQFTKTLQLKSKELNEKEKLLQEREKSLREMQDIISKQEAATEKLNQVLRNALLGFQDDELSIEIKNGKVYVSLSDKLLFKSGSAQIESKGKEAISVLASVLEKNTDVEITVEGHTDNVPIKTTQFKDNWDLSVVRATSIVRMLINDYGLPADRITAAGKGEFVPVADNSTAEGRAKNRRTEIILAPKLDEIMEILNQR